jgi:cytochrome oxidase assembly protein ShyY1
MPDFIVVTGLPAGLGRPRSLTDVVRALLSPRMLALHVAAVLATLAAVLLGVWQYGAWQHGREDQAASRVDAAAKPLAAVMTSDEAFPGDAVGQPVRFGGRWLPRSTVYVADRELGGRSGVWAVTPVAVCGGSPGGSADCGAAPAMLVVRGWARSVGDAPAPPTGAVRVTGWLQPGEGSGVTDTDPGDDVIPEMRVADAIQHVDQDLYGGYVIARGASTTGGLEAVTPASLPKAAALTSLRNLLYALEWWVFGGFALYVWWRWCRDEVSRVTGVPSGA